MASVDLSFENVPKHIGIIMDGNRRFAKKLMLKPWKGHEWGAKKTKQILEWCKEAGIKELTLYAFSIKNFDRPKEEFDYLMNIFLKEFNELIQGDQLEKNPLRINFIGRIHLFPQDVQDAMRTLMEKTKDVNEPTVNFAMAYGGREEIIDATIKIAEEVKAGKLNIDQINNETFGDHLYLKDNVELIIRTSGERRTSDFLPYQGHYAEWFFIEKHWPEFEKEDFFKVLQEYSKRERRFGK